MTQRGEEQIEKLCAEATCLGCEYSLRGLSGEVVTCPECGQKINIVKLVTTRWKGPWYQAPMYDALAIPVGWSIIIVAVMYFTGFDDTYFSFVFSIWHVLGLLPATAGGVWIARKVWRRYGYDEAFTLMFLLHVVMGLYLACAYELYLEASRFLGLLSGFTWVSLLRQTLILLAILLVVFVANRLQRYVGSRCIRRYLRLMCYSGDDSIERKRGDEQFEQLREEAVCPGCKYSLRDLLGDVVTCPECGREINMVAFLKDRWTGPWFCVPGYNAIVAPAIWLVMPLLAVLIWPTLGISDKYPAVAIIVSMIALLVWAWLMLRLRHHHDNGKAPLLALLAHSIVAGYIVGVVTVFVSLIQSVETVSKGGSVAPFAMLIFGAIILWLAKRGEKFIADRCIRQIMVERSRTDTMLP